MPSMRMLALAAVLLPALADAQSIRGHVTLPDGQSPAVGAMVRAQLVEDSTVSARALTGSRGDFLLTLPRPGRYRLTGLRVGFQPTAFGIVDVAPGGVQDARFTLGAGGFAVTVAAVTVDSAALCPDVGASRELVGSLLQQARLALESTLLTSPDGSAQATWQQYSIVTDRLGTPLSGLRIASSVGATDRPFRSVDLAALARDGYFVSRDDRVEFRAPDAEVLLSEAFVGTHCFRLAEDHVSESAWIGIAFEAAAPRRDRTDVAGTLWLDRATAELRRLEFRYVGLPPGLAELGARGTIDFKRLPTGTWFVRAWELRVPRLGRTRVRSGRETRDATEHVSAMRITGGEVTSVMIGTEAVYGSVVRLEDRLHDVTARAGEVPACGTEEPPKGELGILHGSIVDADGAPVGGIDVQLEWIAGRKVQGYVTAFDGFFIVCDVPVGNVIRVTAFRGSRRVSAVLTTRIPARQRSHAFDLVVR